jgi:hypothetical protein
MKRKRSISKRSIPIGDAPANAEHWIRQGKASLHAESPRLAFHSARLTIDVTPHLRGRIKVAAFHQGFTVADLLRKLLEREFPERGAWR